MTIRTWGIGGQAQDDEAAARLLMHHAVGGRVGVLGPLDCRVLPLITPGPGFRVSVGGFVNPVPSKQRQKYGGEIDTEVQVTGLAGTGSGGGRHDLVCLRTNNPLLPGGGNAPPDPVLGEYSNLEVITGVPFGTKQFADLGFLYSAQALARLEYPASTATIGGATGNAKIVDLRASAVGADAASGGSTDIDPVPGTDPVGTPPAAASQFFWEPRQGVAAPDRYLTDVFAVFPTPTPSGSFQVPVPSYARSLAYEAVVENAMTYGGDVSGETRLRVTLGSDNGWSVPQAFRHEWAGQSNSVQVGSAGVYPVGANIRGKLTTFALEARRTAGPGALAFKQGGSWVKLWIQFRA